LIRVLIPKRLGHILGDHSLIFFKSVLAAEFRNVTLGFFEAQPGALGVAPCLTLTICFSSSKRILLIDSMYSFVEPCPSPSLGSAVLHGN
jgi:hypothetical protein